MQKYKEAMSKLTVYLPEDVIKNLSIQAAQAGESQSSMLRRVIVQGLGKEAISENINSVSEVVRRVVRDVIRAETDRLAKLIIKTMKASAVSMYQSAQIVEDIGQNSGQEIFDKSLKKAIEYIKANFDSDLQSLPISGKEAAKENFDYTNDPFMKDD